MGFSFRKSIRIGKHTRINLSKTGGIGISTGVKGARVSVNKKGVRTTLSKNGLQYRKDYSFKNNNNVQNKSKTETMDEIKENIINKKTKKAKKVYPLPEGVHVPKTPSKIIKGLTISIILLVISFVFPVMALLALPSIIVTIVMMITNKEYKSAFLTQKAIGCYIIGDFVESRDYCIRAINKYEDNESAKILLRDLEEVSE